MILCKGNMYNAFPPPTIMLATTNAETDKQGCLVMGTGSALAMKSVYPGIERLFAVAMDTGGYGVDVPYGLLLCHYKGVLLGAFQTKREWRKRAELSLIQLATQKLKSLCELMPHATIFLPFPGIGCGDLERSEVMTVIQDLPSQVVLWEL